MKNNGLVLTSDEIILSSLEKISATLNLELQNLQSLNSVHLRQISVWADEVRAYTRLFEEISLPARLVVEHILDLRYNDGLLGVEAENMKQERTIIDGLQIQEFGVIQVTVGTMHLSWRDGDYNYYFYPDMVELRTADEKFLIKLFFSRNFPQQTQAQFVGLEELPQVIYVHPELMKTEQERQRDE
ncbi:MAG: hypothetical protein FWG14_09510 [Peptococcaceae bacterium]|nr:hypothetical protein [Peptococcaceae bacterium]